MGFCCVACKWYPGVGDSVAAVIWCLGSRGPGSRRFYRSASLWSEQGKQGGITGPRARHEDLVTMEQGPSRTLGEREQVAAFYGADNR